MATSHGAAATARLPDSGVPPGRIQTPRLVYAVIAVCVAGGAFLRLYQLARPGYLLGVTEYDDGVQFGDAVRLVSGIIPYRDFVVVQPPGSIVLMAPVAALAKVTGTAWGLAVTRLLTVAADTACVALLGFLVRHRGALAAGVASGVYAVYPDALVAAHTYLLEPWLNVGCLIAALLVFDRDRVTGSGRRLGWAGVALGLAASVKLWALVPAAVLGILLVRQPRRLGILAGGAAAGLGVVMLPFALMAPGGLVKDVFISQYVRDSLSQSAPVSSVARLTDMAGLSLFAGHSSASKALLVLAAAAAVPLAYLAIYLATRRLPATLDWYAAGGLAVVIVMFLWPYNYWSHYGAFAGPFIALVVALPVGLLRLTDASRQLVPIIAVGVVATTVIAGAGLRQFTAETRLSSVNHSAAADKLIPAGSCVVTNDTSLTISAGRFVADTPGCPPIADAWGTLLAMTDGQKYYAQPQVLAKVTATWRSAFAAAGYVWLLTGSEGQIPWTPGLYAYFTSHFRLVGLVNGPGSPNVPEGGLYAKVR